MARQSNGSVQWNLYSVARARWVFLKDRQAASVEEATEQLLSEVFQLDSVHLQRGDWESFDGVRWRHKRIRAEVFPDHADQDEWHWVHHVSGAKGTGASPEHAMSRCDRVLASLAWMDEEDESPVEVGR